MIEFNTKEHYLIETKEKILLYIGDLKNDQDEKYSNFLKLLHNIRKLSTKHQNIHIIINSGGGNIEEFIALYNAIKLYKKIITEIDSVAYSGGGLLFLIGTDKIINENACIMLHTYYKASEGIQPNILTENKFASKRYTNLFKKIMLDNNFLSKKEFNQLIEGKEFWFEKKEIEKRLK